MVKRIVVLVAGSFALTACGPGAKIDGRQGAAQALFAASQPTKAKADSSSSPVDLTGSISWTCPEGGTANISGASINVGGGDVSTGVTLTYNNCGLAKADVGVAKFNGDLTFSQKTELSSSELSLEQGFKGKLTVEGAFDDFLLVDVVQKIKLSDLDAKSGSISMTLVGDIATSEDAYSFNEAVTVTPGSISAKHIKQ